MPVRFGVVGTGVWADTAHAAGLAAHPGVELVGIWGRDPAKAAAVAERHGAITGADADPLFAQGDAVSFAVTSIEHGGGHPCDARFGAQVVSVLAAAERIFGRPDARRGELLTPRPDRGTS
jgi:hypothetical protein